MTPTHLVDQLQKDSDFDNHTQASVETARILWCKHLTGEIGTLGRRLVELGWSRDQLAYVKQVFNESMDTASGNPAAGKEEG
ncbi:MAG TPA: hypothetical protein VF205_07795 [Nitrospiraceae bacterium]